MVYARSTWTAGWKPMFIPHVGFPWHLAASCHHLVHDRPRGDGGPHSRVVWTPPDGPRPYLYQYLPYHLSQSSCTRIGAPQWPVSFAGDETRHLLPSAAHLNCKSFHDRLFFSRHCRAPSIVVAPSHCLAVCTLPGRTGQSSHLAIYLLADMDDYMFRHYVDECRVVDEATSYVEIFNYSVSRLHEQDDIRMGQANRAQDPFYNSCEEHALTPEDFDSFLRQRVSPRLSCPSMHASRLGFLADNHPGRLFAARQDARRHQAAQWHPARVSPAVDIVPPASHLTLPAKSSKKRNRQGHLCAQGHLPAAQLVPEDGQAAQVALSSHRDHVGCRALFLVRL